MVVYVCDACKSLQKYEKLSGLRNYFSSPVIYFTGYIFAVILYLCLRVMQAINSPSVQLDEARSPGRAPVRQEER